MKNVWYNKDIILKIECCSVDNLQGLISIFTPTLQSIIGGADKKLDCDA